MHIKMYRGVWHAVWRGDAGTQRKSLHTADRAEAERRLSAEQRPAIRLGTVDAIYNAYVNDRETERAIWAWKHLAPTFAALSPADITRPVSRAYALVRRNAGATDGTIHTELTYLRAALRWYDKNTPAVVQLPAKTPPRSDFLTREQYRLLLGKATFPHLRLFIALALATAGRASALLQLTWDRVDFDREQIQLGDGVQRRKGRATVPINPELMIALQTAVKLRTCPYVIEYDSGPIIRIVKGFRSVAKAAGLPWCTPHVLRHTAAVWMAEDGVPMSQIAQFLGHTDSRLTERVYARYGPGFLQAAARSLQVQTAPKSTLVEVGQPIEIIGRSERI